MKAGTVYVLFRAETAEFHRTIIGLAIMMLEPGALVTSWIGDLDER